MNKEKLTNIIWNILPLAIFFVAMLFFNGQIQAQKEEGSDDVYFSTMQKRFSLSEFLTFRYNNWTGRLSTETALYTVFRYDVGWWRVLNSLFLTGLCFNLAFLLLGNQFWLLDYRKTASTVWFFSLGVGFISMYILVPSMFWITGSVFYLWSIAAGSLALIPFRQRLANGISGLTLRTAVWYLFPLLAVVFASLGNEQVSLVLLGLGLLANLYLYSSKKKIDSYLLLLTVVTAVSFSVMVLAPGNQIRYEQETQHWFPTFKELSLVQHLFLGISWLLNKTVNANRFLLILLFILLAMNLDQNAANRTDKTIAQTTAFIAVFLVISSLNLENLHSGFQSWFDDQVYSFRSYDAIIKAYGKPDRYYRLFHLLSPYLLWVSILASVPFLLSRARVHKPTNGITLSILFCAALSSAALMIASPTIFASGDRVLAVYSVILLFILGSLYHSIADKCPTWLMVTIYLIAILNFVFQYQIWIQ